MNAVVLAAGYATRLRPLTETIAKPLLPLAGRPMIDYLCDKIAEVEPIERVHVVTNRRFADGFRAWAERRDGRPAVAVHDDGTESDDDRLGAIGDVQFAIEQAGLANDDLLVAAGDNLFDFSLADYVAFWRSKGTASCIALYQCPDVELVREYSIVELDEDDRVVSFVEKPREPTTNLVGIATYVLHREHVPLVAAYLAERNPPDPLGNLVAWLCRRAPVYGFRFEGDWLDIGNPEQLLEADNRMRAHEGLAARREYAPE